MSNKKVGVENAMRGWWYKTDILDKYREGYIEEVNSLNMHGEDRAVYKVYSKFGVYLLKTTTYSLTNQAIRKKLRNELETVRECIVEKDEKLIVDFLKPIEYRQVENKILHKATVEVLYEYSENSLESIELSISEKIKVMKKVLILMSILESKGIIHANLKPSNIIIKDGKYCIADFGVRLDFQSENMTSNIVYHILNEMGVNAPPEIFRRERKYLNKVDVYMWGMCLYQLITGISADELKKKEKILDEVKSLRLSDKGVSRDIEY